jgi:hypothetical protein
MWRLAHKNSIASEPVKNREDIKAETVEADYSSVRPSEQGAQIMRSSSLSRRMSQPLVLISAKEISTLLQCPVPIILDKIMSRPFRNVHHQGFNYSSLRRFEINT